MDTTTRFLFRMHASRAKEINPALLASVSCVVLLRIINGSVIGNKEVSKVLGGGWGWG